MCTSARALMKPEATSFVHAPARCSLALDQSNACPATPCATTLPRPPHPVPTFVTMANAPLSERDGAGQRGDLGRKGRGIIFANKAGPAKSA